MTVVIIMNVLVNKIQTGLADDQMQIQFGLVIVENKRKKTNLCSKLSIVKWFERVVTGSDEMGQTWVKLLEAI